MSKHEMDEVLKKPNGANFHLADLHIHTPMDKNFSCKERWNFDDPSQRDTYAQGYVRTARDRGLKIIGITEHNDITWVGHIRKAALSEKDKDGNDIDERNRIMVFPGVEVCSKEGIHICTLFNPSEDVKTIDGFLSTIGLTPEQRFSGDSPKPSGLDFDEILDKVDREYSGRTICIPAHVDGDNGLFKTELKRERYLNDNLLVVESKKPFLELREGFQSIIGGKDPNYGNKSVAFINGSDARSLDQIGSRATCIKLSSFSVEGLRQAFLDWKSRIRPSDYREHGNYSRIVAARWSGGGCFLDGYQLHLNPNLNAVIGGKGTGKSTIIESLRYLFDLEPLSDNARSQYKDIVKDVFKSGSTIRALFYSSHLDNYFLIERSYPGQPYVRPINQDLFKGKGIVEEKGLSDLTIDRVLQPEIYGQKEIHDISEDRNFRLALVDRFLDEEFQALQNEELNLLKQLETNKRSILSTLDSVEKLEKYTQELSEIRLKKDKYLKLGIQDRLSTQTKYDKEKLLLEKAVAKVESVKETTAEFFEGLDIDTNFLSDRVIKGLPNENILIETRKALISLSEFMSRKKMEIGEMLSQVEALFTQKEGIRTRWEHLYRQQQEEYQKVLSQLQREEVPLDPEDFRQLEQRENMLKGLIADKEKYEKQLSELQSQRRQMLDNLEKMRLEQFRKREQVASSINSELEGILKVELEYAADRSEFINKLADYGSREARIRRDVIEKMVYGHDFNVRAFVDTLRKGEEGLTREFSLTTGTAANLYRAIPKEDYYDIETWELSPSTSIKLYVGPPTVPIEHRDSGSFKKIEDLSKGQKCTAILTLILLKADRPLIIDQPEDDLDNRFVVDDVVEKLRRQKDKRQFIIATHNANIAVFGDAELITALDADDKHGWEVSCGSIDDEDVKLSVEQILEGGESAFILRKEKYGF